MIGAESNRLEYKREVDKGDKLEKAAVAFLNYNGGGEILVGVAEDGTVIGLSDIDGDQRKIADRLGNNIRPKILGLFDVVADKLEGKNIIRIVVSGGTQKPYYIRKRGMTEDGCFIRVGASAQPMTEAMIERLLQSRQVKTLSTTLSSRQKFTFEYLHIHYKEHGLALNDQFKENLDLLLPSGEYNYLAYLLADNNGASVKIAKYAGTDKIDLIENEEYGHRCLVTAVQKALDKLDVENRTFAKITPRNRLERRLIDRVALREAYINAVVHNDYSLGWPVVEFFSDRVTITSTGGLVQGLSEDDFFNGRSMPRNRELMRIFKDVELVEELGSGMKRILDAYDHSVFEITPSFVIATFPYASDFERDDENSLLGDLYGTVQDGDQVNDQDSGRVTANVTANVTLNVTQAQVLSLIKNNSGITVDEMARQTCRNRRTILRSIQALTGYGFIERIGSDKTGYWKVREVE